MYPHGEAQQAAGVVCEGVLGSSLDFVYFGSMETPKKEMLAITVDANAMLYIKKTAAPTTWTFFGGILVSLMMTAGSLVRYFFVLKTAGSSRLLYFEMRLMPWVTVVSAIITVIQLYLYRRFARQANKALHHADSERFNEAFPFLYRSSVLAIVLVIISFLEIIVSTLLGMSF